MAGQPRLGGVTTKAIVSFDAKTFLRDLPDQPGVYRMIGADDLVFYVGKAKNIQNIH